MIDIDKILHEVLREQAREHVRGLIAQGIAPDEVLRLGKQFVDEKLIPAYPVARARVLALLSVQSRAVH